MKNFKAAALCTILVSMLTACSNNGNPESVAKHFLEAYYKMDLDKAARYASDKTKADIANLQSQIQGVEPTPSEIPEITIKDLIIKGDTAYCRYIVSQDKNDAAALSENLILVKERGEWVADF